MWRIWLLFDPRRALVGLFTFLLVLALVIHFTDTISSVV
jgi:light-harvesting complex 1 alpha chain